MNIKLKLVKKRYRVEFPPGTNMTRLAKLLGVNRVTLYKWQREGCPEKRIPVLQSLPEVRRK